jgi:hypothetical protein
MSNETETPIEKDLHITQSWPPSPSKTPRPKPGQVNANGEITHCPHCKNRLLTLRSIMCSWCGKPIDDEAYLERAAAERAGVDAAMREKLEREAQKPKKVGFIAKITKHANNLLQNDDLA